MMRDQLLPTVSLIGKIEFAPIDPTMDKMIQILAPGLRDLCRINVRADITSTLQVSIVRFDYDGKFFRIENFAGFAFNGNSDEGQFGRCCDCGSSLFLCTRLQLRNQ
jgi:hypothetical protein